MESIKVKRNTKKDKRKNKKNKFGKYSNKNVRVKGSLIHKNSKSSTGI
jgi:hypothetical protein